MLLPYCHLPQIEKCAWIYLRSRVILSPNCCLSGLIFSYMMWTMLKKHVNLAVRLIMHVERLILPSTKVILTPIHGYIRRYVPFRKTFPYRFPSYFSSFPDFVFFIFRCEVAQSTTSTSAGAGRVALADMWAISTAACCSIHVYIAFSVFNVNLC